MKGAGIVGGESVSRYKDGDRHRLELLSPSIRIDAVSSSELGLLVRDVVIATLNIAQNSIRLGLGVVLFAFASMTTSREYRTWKCTPRKPWRFIGLHLLYLAEFLILSTAMLRF